MSVRKLEQLDSAIQGAEGTRLARLLSDYDAAEARTFSLHEAYLQAKQREDADSDAQRQLREARSLTVPSNGDNARADRARGARPGDPKEGTMSKKIGCS